MKYYMGIKDQGSTEKLHTRVIPVIISSKEFCI